jgi:hypothetical protein
MTKRLIFLLSIVFCAVCAVAQAAPAPPDAPSSLRQTSPEPPPQPYVRPSERTKARNFVFDAVGPYAILGAAIAAGINQADSTPPEWGQGASAYGQRFASNLGIAAITTTARYAMAEAFREDTIYYRCECKPFAARFEHAIISTVTARTGEDGHRRFSVPSLVAPYVGTMTAVYGWYPDRYNAEDAFRMGNYTLLGAMGNNVALEFLYGGPHTLLSRFRLHKKN